MPFSKTKAKAFKDYEHNIIQFQKTRNCKFLSVPDEVVKDRISMYNWTLDDHLSVDIPDIISDINGASENLLDRVMSVNNPDTNIHRFFFTSYRDDSDETKPPTPMEGLSTISNFRYSIDGSFFYDDEMAIRFQELVLKFYGQDALACVNTEDMENYVVGHTIFGPEAFRFDGDIAAGLIALTGKHYDWLFTNSIDRLYLDYAARNNGGFMDAALRVAVKHEIALTNRHPKMKGLAVDEDDVRETLMAWDESFFPKTLRGWSNLMVNRTGRWCIGCPPNFHSIVLTALALCSHTCFSSMVDVPAVHACINKIVRIYVMIVRGGETRKILKATLFTHEDRLVWRIHNMYIDRQAYFRSFFKSMGITHEQKCREYREHPVFTSYMLKRYFTTIGRQYLLARNNEDSVVRQPICGRGVVPHFGKI